MDVFWQAFEFRYLIILFLGLFLGIVVGALPGLTPTMGVALTIPFTFSLGATEGLIILGGIYCGSVYGGSIPAILFNVPGAPASVATTFDGFPMTQNGEARKALEVSTIASVFGGIFGMVLLLFFAPIVSEFSLQFGPTENFWIAIFGLTVIAAISDGSISKNLLGGSIGIYLSFVGIHTVTGLPRFTFGSESLIGGFHVVAILIGLFAFPQALRLIEHLTAINHPRPLIYKIKKSTIRQSFSDVLKKPKSLGIGSLVGAFIGMIPGAGGNIASILAYNEVKRFSKDKEGFGKGEKKGIIASESANNAMVGGSLIPLLTLGIPGSPTAAIFLGGLLIHGIWPGRSLFVENTDVAYTFLFSMVGAQILLLFLGLAMIKYMTKLSQIPTFIMAPVILSFSIIGAFCMQNNVFDIYTVVMVGIVMFILDKFGFAAAPVALGFILGPIAEQGLLHGIQVGKANGSILSMFLSGSINIILCALVVITISISIYQQIKLKSIELRSSKKVNFLSLKGILWQLAAVLVITGLILLQNFQLEQRIFPQIVLGVVLLLIVVEYLKAIRAEKNQGNNAMSYKWSSLPIVCIVAFLSVLTSITGYYLQVIMLMLAVPCYLVFVKKNKDIRLWTVFIVTIVFTAFLYLIFSQIIQVPVPTIFTVLNV
ncbi:tripartite tricarboxylate transporter permease [Aquibacillus kalidii]|uniref:tripartite tricarboxylate transporter permease n=1 Tax=Aquibacillus kalidii TaxID=2762597 RepID=UPI0016443E53|nr:tripartite tricarboxylate transporter permease [Aquibacillus kalidii]